MIRSPRFVLGLVLGSLFAVAACSSGTTTTGEAPAPGGSAPAGAGAFPVTIEHRYGSTTISEKPTRVVTVGLTDQDAVLALGVTPVGTTDWFGNHPGAVWPWATGKVGSEKPEITGTAQAIGFEKIAERQPDLILALYSGITKADYDKLSEIAPTVAAPSRYVDYGIPWEEQTRITGKALGDAAKADELVGDVNGKIDAVTTAHPEFEGATGLVVSPYSGLYSVYAPQDGRGRFMASLGFTQPPEIEQLAGKEFSADLSPERVGLLDVKVIVWLVNSIATDKPKFDENALYANLAVHREQREVFVETNGPLGGALSFQSVLSVPVLLDQLVPQLATGVKGNRAG